MNENQAPESFLVLRQFRWSWLLKLATATINFLAQLKIAIMIAHKMVHLAFSRWARMYSFHSVSNGIVKVVCNFIKWSKSNASLSVIWIPQIQLRAYRYRGYVCVDLECKWWDLSNIQKSCLLMITFLSRKGSELNLPAIGPGWHAKRHVDKEAFMD